MTGNQFLFSHGKIFQKGWFVSKENDPLKTVYLSVTHPAGIFLILQNLGSGLLELSSYMPPVTSCVPFPWHPPIKKKKKSNLRG